MILHTTHIEFFPNFDYYVCSKCCNKCFNSVPYVGYGHKHTHTPLQLKCLSDKGFNKLFYPVTTTVSPCGILQPSVTKATTANTG